ncbi:MAG: class I SAM-dependent methyltransferase [Myxococcales bacterium]|nr:class I SAM-dependent methyltransferase [Myxococcales bacterium]
MSSERAQVQAEMLKGRVKKAFRKWYRQYSRQDIGVFRLYDWDIPEVRAVVDWYEGHLVVGEYTRRQTQAAGDWLYVMGSAVAEALGVPPSHLHLKRRRTGGKGQRYAGGQPMAHAPKNQGLGQIRVRERGLRFWVNLKDYLDTGLFADHRDTRSMVRTEAQGRAVLNLFSYTGSFSVSALAGGARHVTSVDASRTYLDWSQKNIKENELPLQQHEPVRSDVLLFLQHAATHGRRWGLVIVDPPSFSSLGGEYGFDVQKDHPELLRWVLRVTAPGGTIFFSTNHQRFSPELDGLNASIEETTHQTVPRDYRNRYIHRSWRIFPRS